MQYNKDGNRRGGSRPGSGRPHLNGQPPGQGEYLRKVTVSLPAETIAWLREIGDGNVSRGIRRLAAIAREEDKFPHSEQAGN